MIIIFLYNQGCLVAESRSLAIKIDDLRQETRVLIVLMSVASNEERQKENVRGCRVLWPPWKSRCGDGGSEEFKLHLLAVQPTTSNDHTQCCIISMFNRKGSGILGS